MSYPNRPIPGIVPTWLNPFDPSFMDIATILGSVTVDAVPVFGGGAVVQGGEIPPLWNQNNAVFAWAFVGVVGPHGTPNFPTAYMLGVRPCPRAFVINMGGSPVP